MSNPPVDAVLVLSFGGPHGPDDVLPFLRNVTAGRGISDTRLAEVAEHYLHFGGVSPITAQNEALVSALRSELTRIGIELDVYFGNRNWTPYVTDTLAQMSAAGVRHALVLATSATSSYSGCRQYREDLAGAQAAVSAAGEAPVLTKLRHYFDNPGFIAANAAAVSAALDGMPAETRLVFTAHSIPESMNATAGPTGGLYLAQQRATAQLVADRVRGVGASGVGAGAQASGVGASAEANGMDAGFDLVWQSRSGPPQVPWLEPDINDHLRALAADGVRDVVIAPTGFVSDHMEVIWDLDNEAADTARSLGIRLVRAATAGTDAAFVAGLAALVAEQLGGPPVTGMSALGVCGWQCPATCCPAPARRPRPVPGVEEHRS